MSTDPDQIRAAVSARLAELPDIGADPVDIDNADIEAVAAQLEAAHDLLVHALEAVDRAPAAPGAPR